MTTLAPDVAEVLLGSVAARHTPQGMCSELTRELFIYYLRDQVTPGVDQMTTCQQNQMSLNRLLAGAISLLDDELTERAAREGRTIQSLLHEILLAQAAR